MIFKQAWTLNARVKVIVNIVYNKQLSNLVVAISFVETIDKVYIDRPCDLLIRRSIDKFLSDVLYARYILI